MNILPCIMFKVHSFYPISKGYPEFQQQKTLFLVDEAIRQGVIFPKTLCLLFIAGNFSQVLVVETRKGMIFCRCIFLWLERKLHLIIRLYLTFFTFVTFCYGLYHTFVLRLLPIHLFCWVFSCNFACRLMGNPFMLRNIQITRS